MSVSDELLQEFIALYKKEFGEELSVAEARTMTGELLALYRLLYRPLPEVHDERETKEA